MESNPQSKKSIREYVIEAVKCGDVKMRPKWHFVVQAIIAIIGGIILALLVLFIASLIIFMLRQSGALFVPVFGLSGWLAFILALPWVLIFFCVALIIGFEILLRKYSYKQPLVYSILGVAIITIVGGVALAQTSIHVRIGRFAQEKKIPLAAPLYRQSERDLDDIHPGQIVQILNNGFIMSDRRGSTTNVFITDDTRLPFDASFATSDLVIVFGGRATDTIEAIGIRRIEPGMGQMMFIRHAK